ESVSGLFRVVAAVGLAGLGAGLGGMLTTDTPEVRRQWLTVAAGGSAVAFGGIVFSAMPASQARRLHDDITLTLPQADLEAQVEHFNEALAP
ncbi:MAG: hypothetical protein AAGA48_37250, partial [Myxococcota bacterium]